MALLSRRSYQINRVFQNASRFGGLAPASMASYVLSKIHPPSDIAGKPGIHVPLGPRPISIYDNFLLAENSKDALGPPIFNSADNLDYRYAAPRDSDTNASLRLLDQLWQLALSLSNGVTHALIMKPSQRSP
jgi:hypothetical protein